MASKFFAVADRKSCVSCGACFRECPRDAIRIDHGCYAVMDPALCIGCGKCRRICPADCIGMEERKA